MPDTHGAKTNVNVGEADPEQAQPCPKHVLSIEAADRVEAARTRLIFREGIKEASNQMAK